VISPLMKCAKKVDKRRATEAAFDNPVATILQT
jgi:hypothetical protein